MPTLQQLIKKNRYKSTRINSNLQSPQKKGVCLKVYSINPKKPNSADRKVARVKLSNNKIIIGYIPGEGNSLQEHSIVLVRGGRVKDLPGVRYHLIRGVYDLSSVNLRKSSRSKAQT